MVDPSTTDDHMTPSSAPARGTATVPKSPDTVQPLGWATPPPVTSAVDEALLWLVAVTATAGQPDWIDVSATTRQIGVATPNRQVFARWATAIGAVARPAKRDALGSNISAATVHPDRWRVAIHVHVNAYVEVPE